MLSTSLCSCHHLNAILFLLAQREFPREELLVVSIAALSLTGLRERSRWLQPLPGAELLPPRLAVGTRSGGSHHPSPAPTPPVPSQRSAPGSGPSDKGQTREAAEDHGGPARPDPPSAESIPRRFPAPAPGAGRRRRRRGRAPQPAPPSPALLRGGSAGGWAGKKEGGREAAAAASDSSRPRPRREARKGRAGLGSERPDLAVGVPVCCGRAGPGDL